MVCAIHKEHLYLVGSLEDIDRHHVLRPSKTAHDVCIQELNTSCRFSEEEDKTTLKVYPCLVCQRHFFISCVGASMCINRHAKFLPFDLLQSRSTIVSKMGRFAIKASKWCLELVVRATCSRRLSFLPGYTVHGTVHSVCWHPTYWQSWRGT